jgi:hypothetical protein
MSLAVSRVIDKNESPRPAQSIDHAIDPRTVRAVASDDRGGGYRLLPRAIGNSPRIPDHLRSLESRTGGHVLGIASRSATTGMVVLRDLDFDLELFDGWRYQTED